MKVISLNGAFKLRLKKTCAAIGIFDGVHRGHQYLIKQMLTSSRRLKAQPIVITFFPHPAHILQPDLKLGYLTSLEDRFRALSDLGVSACLVVRFNRSFAKIQPQVFIKDILVKKLGVKAVFVGEDFRFGKDRSGDIALFQRLGPQYGYEMHAVSALKQGRAVISSTRIRQLIGAGQLNDAARLLGRRVSISGLVVKGSARGKSLGFPTANIAYEADILPPQGVYVVKVLLGKKEYPAIANVGTRPSFKHRGRLPIFVCEFVEQNRELSPILEVHILDFSKNIYGRHLEVKFLKKIRNEKRFPSPQALVRQIQKDESFARKYMGKKKLSSL